MLQLRPEWTQKLGVVMTSGNDDPEEWREIIGNKRHKDAMAKKFKDNDSELKIAIVVDMWLTGFDVPSLATMYVYKPMEEHKREEIGHWEADTVQGKINSGCVVTMVDRKRRSFWAARWGENSPTMSPI